MQAIHKPQPYVKQLKHLLDEASLTYCDGGLRVELYKADDTLYIMSTSEGLFVKHYEEFGFSGDAKSLLPVLDAMERVAPLDEWEIKA